MRMLDLFSGIGGFSLGLERSGAAKTVAFCEIDSYCRQVLAKHWPGIPIYDDVRTLTASRLAADGISVDAICGGFPCQDISCAASGYRAGLGGERSGLWFEYTRLIDEIRPRFAIIENVPRLRVLGIDRVLSDLEALGYAAEPFVVGAIHAGAPHRRQRVWIVAHAHSETWRSEEGNAVGGGRTAEAGLWAAQLGGRSGCPDAANAYSEPVERTAIARSQCGSWSPEPGVGRVVDGVPRELVEPRLRALGNAVVPQVVEAIGRAIVASLEVAA